jgi:hypothetical protein
MGLFVVGRLGARHGIPVHLGGAPTGGPGGGVTASVTLPAHLVVSSGEPAAPQPRTVAAAPAAVPNAGRNGILPARTGSSVRPAPRAALPAQAEAPAQPLHASGGANGLPTRTPGSSLRRDLVTGKSPAPFAAEPAGPPPPVADAPDKAPNGVAPRPDDERVGAEQRPPAGPDAEEGEPKAGATDTGTGEGRGRIDATDDGAAADATPTEAVPVVAAEGAAQPGGAPERPASEADDTASDGAPTEVTAAEGVPEKPDADDERAAPAAAAQNGHDSADAPADTTAPDAGSTARPAAPRPRPAPAPNGAHRERVPSTPYQPDGGPGQNGTADSGDTGDTGIAPPTRPLPAVPGSPAQPVSAAAEPAPDDAADALFAASVPAISEPDGLPRARRPIGELRRSPATVEETTPIFAEIASAWFASDRPVPVDWELGKRPGAEFEPDAPNSPDASRPAPPEPAGVLDAPERPADRPTGEPVAEPPAESFATAADEGWAAASGAAAERPDELTAAGLPKRRPRARLVPGSAGSAVLAATAPPTRSAENIRGRLASYQQGVRQGRENRLRRELGGAGPQSVTTEENGAAPAGGEHDEESR